MMREIKIYAVLAFVLLGLMSCKQASEQAAGPKKVVVVKSDSSYFLEVDGKPFFVKGGGLEYGNMEALKAHGGNAFRTWRYNNSKHTGMEVLNKADSLGLMVVMGLELAKERHGFDYNDAAAVEKQKQQILDEVKQMKDHPALLAYGLGNELNLRYTNPKVWDAVNDLAVAIHQIDPNHPVTTMLAGADKEVIAQIMQRAPDLDFLSFQIYGDIVNLPRYIKESGYQGPYFITEWGATGHWEVPQTSWGRPIEPTSNQKASDYMHRYQQVIEKNTDRCLGSFVFLWGQKQERTPTWYGLFLENGDETETVDAMHYVWNGEWPKNRTPQLKGLLMNHKNAYQNVIVTPGEEFLAEVDAIDPESDSLVYQWEILKEVEDHLQSDGGDYEPIPEKVAVFNPENHGAKVRLNAPKTPGEYRLLVYVSDGHKHSGTANIPFKVQ